MLFPFDTVGDKITKDGKVVGFRNSIVWLEAETRTEAEQLANDLGLMQMNHEVLTEKKLAELFPAE